jgi:hypothetical protein
VPESWGGPTEEGDDIWDESGRGVCSIISCWRVMGDSEWVGANVELALDICIKAGTNGASLETIIQVDGPADPVVLETVKGCDVLVGGLIIGGGMQRGQGRWRC